MELWVGALSLGFLYAIMTMGVYITFRVFDFPDVTVDGSFTAGAAITAVLIVAGVNPLLALSAAGVIGAAAGLATAVIHSRLNVNGLLAGILVMTGLYSINLHVMGRSNIPLLNQVTFFSYLERSNPGLPVEVWTCAALGVGMVLFWILVSLFFRTDLGIAMRATGNNPVMAAANGVNVDRMKAFGVSLANALVGISGGLVAQYQGFADIGMGIGTVVIGLAAVIMGESVLRMRSMYARILSVIVGSVIFRLMIAVALFVGMNPIDLKLLTAVFVLLTLIGSKTLGRSHAKLALLRGRVSQVHFGKRVGFAFGAVLLIVGLACLGYRHFTTRSEPTRIAKIGVLQLVDNALLDITRESLVEELARLGYEPGKNCMLMVENANGDVTTVNTVLDKFLQEKVDVVVPISTVCAQAAINKFKDRPVVFATVANPFIIGAGTSDTDHLANVTGVYGWVPMDKTLEVVRKVCPEKRRLGVIWDPGQANAVFNVENLRKAVAEDKELTFEGATITNSSEVYQAACSLIQRGTEVFILAPDNIVYSAFESVVKAARPHKVPIFISDVERLQDGALGALGYDYTSSGIQAAHLVDRVLKGELPKTIPFERYKKLSLGFNREVAKELGITIPPELLAQETGGAGTEAHAGAKVPKIGMLQFALEPNVEVCKQGILKALADRGFQDGKNIEIIYKNAQADFAMINAIVQDFIRRDVDILVPLSTPCLQAAVQLAGVKGKPTVVFTYVYDPYRIGAGKTSTDHLPTVTGISCMQSLEPMLALIKEMFPQRKKIGVVWNSSEANSEAMMIQLRKEAGACGAEIVEATVTSPAEVLEAARSLVFKGAGVFLNAGDNTVNVSFDSFVKVARESKIPVFSVDSELCAQGALAALGPSYFQTGYEGGEYVARVLKGERPADIPIGRTTKTVFNLNLDAARAQGFTIPEALKAKADQVIDQARAPGKSQTGGEPKRAVVFLFSETVISTDGLRGVRDELQQSGFTEEQLAIDLKNAQNELYLAQSIAQDIVRQAYDYIITLSTPALQVTANTNKKIPHVFGLVTDPYRMGVAKSPTNHLLNVTGVATLQPVETTIKVMREVLPQARRLGIVWNPGEACSEACTLKAREAAKTYGFELREATVNGTADVADALATLLNRGIDVFLTSGDNTVIMAMDSVVAALRKHKIPYFTNGPSDVERGAFLSIGADYYEVGRETGRMASRVIRGEDPKDIPISNYVPEKMHVNSALAQEYGIVLPDSFLARAAFVKRK